MTNLKHSYDPSDFIDYTHDLSTASEIRINDCNTFQLHSNNGSGLIKNLFFEEGFSIRYFNFSVKQDVEFEWFSQHDTDQVVYKLIYILETSESNSLDSKNILPFNSNQNNNTVLYLPDFFKKMQIKKNTHVHRIALLFTNSWLEKNFLEASNKIITIIKDLRIKNKPTLLSGFIDSKSFVLANEIANEMDNTSFPLIHIKTRSLLLLNDFLNNIVKQDKQDIRSDQTIHYHTMIMVENRLRQCIESKMPCQHQLAAEFNLSTSTLKRHFRKVYGKNAYIYYQEKRLALGRKMLENEHKTINEVALTLGYNKTNSFSKAFRKYFGFLPRELKYSRDLIAS
jgi:AraC-like DNA-binding protein